MPGPASRRTTSLLTLITRPLTPMREAAMVVAGLAAGTGIAAWSLVRNLGEGLPSSWGDTVFNAWILAWSADRLSHGLRGFWDAPFFYPYSDTLAFSEHLLGIGIFTAPIQWLTGNPIVAQNMAFLASYLLAGGGMYLLVRDLTGSRLAGFVSGVAFAFLPYRTFDTRIQVLMYGWTPLALWALHRYFTTGRRAALAAFAVGVPPAGIVERLRLLFGRGRCRRRRSRRPARADAPADVDRPDGDRRSDARAAAARHRGVPPRAGRARLVSDPRRERAVQRASPPVPTCVAAADVGQSLPAVPGSRVVRLGRARRGCRTVRSPSPDRAHVRRGRRRRIRPVAGAGAGRGRRQTRERSVRLVAAGRARSGRASASRNGSRSSSTSAPRSWPVSA